jgi:1,4-dihydroxy-2-naphthoate octaprenyltransferase
MSPGPSFITAALAFIRLGRPLFLVGGFILYGLGAAVAAHLGTPIALERYLLGQSAVTTIQLMTHYCNDYFDYEGDVINTNPTPWSGGSRVLVRSEVPRTAALVAAMILAAIAVALGAYIACHFRGVPLVVPILLGALVLSWEYSAPPWRLHSTGWGEVDVAFVVTGTVPFLGYYLQAPSMIVTGTLWLAIVPPVLLQLAMMLAVELPDATADAIVGKQTLVVRIGAARAALFHQWLTAFPYLVLPLLVAAGLPRSVALLAAASAPIAGWRIYRMSQGDWREPKHWSAIAFWSVALLIAVSSAELAGFILLGRIQ